MGLAGRFRLQSNSALREVSDRISSQAPDWGYLASVFRNTDDYRNGNQSELHVCSLLGEIHLRSSLERACSGLKGAKYCPVENGSEAGAYTFKKNGIGQLEIKTGLRSYGEVDGLIEVEGLASLFELKLTGSFRGQAKNVMSLSRISRVLDPMSNLFKTGSFGYVIVGYPEVVDREDANDFRLRRDFLKAGGLLVPFYYSRMDFMKRAREVIEDFGLMNGKSRKEASCQ